MAARKQAKNKSLFVKYKEGGNNLQDWINFCNSTGLPYTLKKSNYRTIIESEFCNRDFMQSMVNKQAFFAANMIVKDIRESGLTNPEINPADLIYFDFAPPEILKDAGETIYNIDLKSAYAMVLYNHCIISKKTFGYMSKLAKKDRLACVGMLAANKKCFVIEGGKAVKHWSEKADTKEWFYFCVQRTNEIMNEIRNLLGADFLFYWVDGIFFRENKIAKEVIELLNNYGYKCSFDICRKFNYKETDREKIITYWKVGENKSDFKRLTLPKRNNEVDLYFRNLINEIMRENNFQNNLEN